MAVGLLLIYVGVVIELWNDVIDARQIQKHGYPHDGH